MCVLVQEEKFITSNFEDLGVNRDVHRTLYCDNMSSIMMSNSNNSAERAIYIGINQF